MFASFSFHHCSLLFGLPILSLYFLTFFLVQSYGILYLVSVSILTFSIYIYLVYHVLLHQCVSEQIWIAKVRSISLPMLVVLDQVICRFNTSFLDLYHIGPSLTIRRYHPRLGMLTDLFFLGCMSHALVRIYACFSWQCLDFIP